jgi:hypothetical protein
VLLERPNTVGVVVKQNQNTMTNRPPLYTQAANPLIDDDFLILFLLHCSNFPHNL